MFHKRIVAFTLLAAPLGVLAQLPNGWFGYQNSRWSECNEFYSTCKPTKSACAADLCNQCYSMGGAGFKSCCNEPTPYLCFQSAAAGGGGGGAGGGNQLITSAPPPSITDPQQIACQTAVDIVQACESAVPGFDNLDDSEIASCLCYSGSVWQPQSFDQPWSSCINWASTADASDLAVWTTLRGFCSRVGDVVNAPASAAATTTQASSPNSAPATATGPVLQSEATTTTTKAAGASQGASTGDSTGARTTSSSTSASSSGASSKSGARMLANPKELLPQMLTIFVISTLAGALML